jgi:hypothetical protein
VSMEYAGAVEVDPPARADEHEWLRACGWSPARDGRTIRPRPDMKLDDWVDGLRDLVSMAGDARIYDGVVAAYDDEKHALVIVTVRGGRVTRRAARKPRPVVRQDNVIDLATRRRAAPSRPISRPIA